jgi:glycosyltransferase involved in cell wall biosynthesis
MTEIPQVSVVMAVHNGERYITEAIESTLGQTLRELEFIVVDDASSDGTEGILAAYAARDRRVRVLRNERNIGPYPSANRALGVAQAPLIARIDADDISEPGRLAAQVDFLNRHPECLLVGSGYRSIDANGAVNFVRHNPLDFDLAAFVARLRMPFVHPSFCFRRVLPDGEPVLYDPDRPIAGDYTLAARLAGIGPIASLSDPLVRYRMHAENISSTKLDRQNFYAHQVASAAIAAHYPASIAEGLAQWLEVSYDREPATLRALRISIRAFEAALAHDFGENPPLRVRERAAGLMTEAFFKRDLSPALLGALVMRGSRHLVPLALRVARLRNWLPPHPGPR